MTFNLKQKFLECENSVPSPVTSTAETLEKKAINFSHFDDKKDSLLSDELHIEFDLLVASQAKLLAMLWHSLFAILFDCKKHITIILLQSTIINIISTKSYKFKPQWSLLTFVHDVLAYLEAMELMPVNKGLGNR